MFSLIYLFSVALSVLGWWGGEGAEVWLLIKRYLDSLAGDPCL